MEYEVINNYSHPVPDAAYVGDSASDELEVHVTSDDGIDLKATVTVTVETTYLSHGSYDDPPDAEYETTFDVEYESYGREPSENELAAIYDRCIEIAAS